MPVHESVAAQRRQAIARLGVLERAGHPSLTGITRIASYVTGAAAAAIHILDDTRQRRIAAENAPLGEHPREDALCRLVVDAEERIICADASLDPRFGYSSFVEGEDPIRFFASVPLRTSDAAVVGTLCAFDTIARELSERQIALLEELGDQVVSQLELTRIALDLGHIASHDALTGAATQLVLADRLSQAFARELRYGGDTLLIVVEIDELKLVRDRLGLLAGNEVLFEVAKRLRLAVRGEDTVARTGPGTFAVLAEVASESHAEEILLRRVTAALAEPIQCAGEGRQITVSVGSAFADIGEDARAVLRRAAAGARVSREPAAAPVPPGR